MSKKPTNCKWCGKKLFRDGNNFAVQTYEGVVEGSAKVSWFCNMGCRDTYYRVLHRRGFRERLVSKTQYDGKEPYVEGVTPPRTPPCRGPS